MCRFSHKIWGNPYSRRLPRFRGYFTRAVSRPSASPTPSRRTIIRLAVLRDNDTKLANVKRQASDVTLSKCLTLASLVSLSLICRTRERGVDDPWESLWTLMYQLQSRGLDEQKSFATPPTEPSPDPPRPTMVYTEPGSEPWRSSCK